MIGGTFDFDALPNGLREADLLAWVEADARARAEHAPGSSLDRVSRAIEADPGLGAQLESMRVDRAALGSLETPAPPMTLAQSVLEEHERQALLALSDMAAMGPRALEQQVDIDEPLSFASFPSWFKPALASAAVLALAIAAWQLIPLALPRSGPGLPAPTTGVPSDLADASGDGGTVEPAPFTIEPIAQAPVLAAEPLATVPTIASVPEPRPADVLAARLEMPTERAREMARSGRLMVVVGVDRLEPVQDAITTLSRMPIESTWRLEAPAVELVAALTEPAMLRHSGIYSDRSGPLVADRDGPLGRLEVILAATPTVHVAQVSNSPEALLGLLDVLDLLGTEARVFVTDASMPTAGSMPPPLNSDVLLWWDADPASWEPWTAIPVRFIEQR
ncbi:MAG: hypothetical protein ACFCBV_02980 [Phycisphaerales bacterium]